MKNLKNNFHKKLVTHFSFHFSQYSEQKSDQPLGRNASILVGNRHLKCIFGPFLSIGILVYASNNLIINWLEQNIEFFWKRGQFWGHSCPNLRGGTSMGSSDHFLRVWYKSWWCERILRSKNNV